MRVDSPVGTDDQPPPFSNPLVWWKAHAKELPLLSELAKRFLCIQQLQHHLSEYFRLTIAKTRAALLPEHANDLIFLHDSWDFAEKFCAAQQNN